jgi:CDP-ribitol ribitolphosphotransferase
MLLTVRIWSVRLVHRLASLVPLRRRVVLATGQLDRLAGNLAIIQTELARREPPIPVTVLAARPRGGWRGRAWTFWRGLVGAFHLATSRVFIVDDYYFPIYPVRRRPGTLVVQTWHASGAFKKFGLSVLDKTFGADPGLASRVSIHGNYDVCLIGSQEGAVHYAEAFGQPLERFRWDLGIPRTDVLFGDERLARTTAALRARYAIPEGRRIVLYAPTFRGEHVTAARYDAGLDLATLQAVLGDDHVVLVKLHPFIRAAAPIGPELAGFAIDVSDHPDINELLPLADVLVTDYSSVIFEYALLGRPMVFYAPDLSAYEDERGFYFDYRSWVPGPVAVTSDEVAACLRAAEFDPARIAAFRARSIAVADGHATERFVDQLVLPALGG